MDKNPFITLSKAVYEILLERIITFKYAPEEKLVEYKLADEFEISRSPVHEALQILEDEGFVKKLNTTTIVAPFNAKEYDDLIIFRHIIEPAAAGYASTLMTDDDYMLLKKYADLLSKAFIEHDYVQSLKYENLFHEFIIQCSHNQYIIKAYKNIEPYLTRCRATYLALNEEINPITFSDEHYLIYNCLKLKNKELAESIVRQLLWTLLPASITKEQIDISDYNLILKLQNDLISGISQNL